MNYLTLATGILNVICVVILIIVIYLIYKPTPLANYIAKVFDLTNNDIINDNENVSWEQFTDDSGFSERILTYSKPENKTDKVLIEIPGGAFIRSTLNISAYVKMNLPYDVILIEYPVLFSARTNQTLSYLRQVIKFLIHRARIRNPEVQIYIVGYSAGCYYAMTLINEMVNDIVGLVTICGYFGTASVSNGMFKTLDWMYIDHDNRLEQQVLINSNVRLMIMVGTGDFLKESSLSFASWNAVDPFVYEGSHLFFWDMNNIETDRAHVDFKDFIELPIKRKRELTTTAPPFKIEILQ